MNERVALEVPGPLSKSLIWAVQRAGYEGAGIEAWRQGLVPSQVTSNPFLAAGYARVVRRFLGEVATDGGADEPVTIVELGGGSGQFAFHFVRILTEMCRRGRPAAAFRYVLTDFAEANRDAWRTHTVLGPMIADGRIEIAGFDAGADAELHPEGAPPLRPDGSQRRGVVIANYLFDAIPQDCFVVNDAGLHEVYCAAHAPEGAEPVRPGRLLGQVSLDFTTVPIDGDRYPRDAINRVLADAAATRPLRSFLFPGVALDCLERVSSIFVGGLVMLSADKGFVRSIDPLTADGPFIAEHGPIFSMAVNYDAIGRWFETQGGVAIHPPRRPTALTLSFGAVGFAADAVADTAAAFEDCVDALNPDDFYTLQASLRRAGGGLDDEGAMALLRMSGWDSEVLIAYAGPLGTVGDDLRPARVQELVDAIGSVWERRYPVDPGRDVAVAIARLLYGLGLYAEAATYLEQSLRDFGPIPSVLYDLAMCHVALQDPATALGFADRAAAADPGVQLPDGLRRALEAARGQES